jgi:hypothetical protein
MQFLWGEPRGSIEVPNGIGIAVNATLGLLVTSDVDTNTLKVFAIPTGWVPRLHASAAFPLECTLGGAVPSASMQFRFNDVRGWSGWMAFTGPDTCGHLVVSDCGHDAVHVIDVVGRAHVGYVAAPGMIAGPRGVATRGTRVAISAYGPLGSRVYLFEGGGAEWVATRSWAPTGASVGVCGHVTRPYGLRFTRDGTGLAVTSAGNSRAYIISTEDGAIRKLLASGLSGPSDVEECEGGWIVTCWSSETVEFVGNRGSNLVSARAKLPVAPGENLSMPASLVVVPGLGLLVRNMCRGAVRVFWTPDMVAMGLMSPVRVAWCTAVVRARSCPRATCSYWKRRAFTPQVPWTP